MFYKREAEKKLIQNYLKNLLSLFLITIPFLFEIRILNSIHNIFCISNQDNFERYENCRRFFLRILYPYRFKNREIEQKKEKGYYNASSAALKVSLGRIIFSAISSSGL